MSVETILTEFGERLVVDLQANLKSKQQAKASKHGTPYNANSSLVNSIKFKIIQEAGSITFRLEMNDYFDWVDRGRDAGGVSETGQDNIKQWIKVKALNPVKIISGMRAEARAKAGITSVYKPRKKLTFEKATKALTFLVARKLKNKGYDGNFFYSEIILDGRVEQLEKDILEATGEEINIIFRDFKQST